MTVLEAVIDAVRGAASFNPHVEEAPVCVLWTDSERLFEPLLPTLQSALPEFFVLGDYAPDEKRGPAIWLRYMLDGGRIESQSPILYLPGVSRAELRPEEDCPFLLAPLCELTFRGKVWAHENGKDWTPSSLLLAQGIDIAGDAATREALQRALPRLMAVDVDELKAQMPLTATVLNDLLNPEPVESLLGWMTAPAAWKATQPSETWMAFSETCKQKFSFHPTKDGELRAAELLGERQGAWGTVWRVFERSPHRFTGVVELLRRVRPKPDSLFFLKSSWPQINTEEEDKLRKSLLALSDVPATEARSHVAEMEALHGERRTSVWAQLGLAPLAQALLHLSTLATETTKLLTGATPQEMAEQWTQSGWRSDAALLDALASVDDASDVEAVRVATRALYRDWLDGGAQQFSQRVASTPLQAGSGFGEAGAGVCYLFTDGLRFDVAQKLATELSKAGMPAQCQWQFGPLPGVTPTAKPAATPLNRSVFGPGANLETVFADGRKVTAESLRNELKKAGYQILIGAETGQPDQGPAWTECGNFDRIGHDFGAVLARRITEEIKGLTARIRQLITAGWNEVRVTTDHGWVLLPGGLDKAHLPEHLTEVRKGRCARMKAGNTTDCQTVPWCWDSAVNIAIAPGARCFEEGKEYEHGGLSVQECVLPLLTVGSAAPKTPSLRIGAIKWKGFRCVVTIEGETPQSSSGSFKMDMRTKLADAASSLCNGGRSVASESVALVVEDDSYRGAAVHVVLLDASGNALDKVTTAVPED